MYSILDLPFEHVGGEFLLSGVDILCEDSGRGYHMMVIRNLQFLYFDFMRKCQLLLCCTK